MPLTGALLEVSWLVSLRTPGGEARKPNSKVGSILLPAGLSLWNCPWEASCLSGVILPLHGFLGAPPRASALTGSLSDIYPLNNPHIFQYLHPTPHQQFHMGVECHTPPSLFHPWA